MRLFVWLNPYHVPWGTSLVVALAETVEDARLRAAEAFAKVSNSPPPVLGEPNQVLDAPEAIWFEFGE